MSESDPNDPSYDVTADPSSKYYLGLFGSGEGKSGDDIRAEVTREVDQEIARGWLGPVVSPQKRDEEIQRLYSQGIDRARQGLGDGLQLRQPGTPPSTVWANASHEQMQEAISQNASSVAVAVTSEEWVRVADELAEHRATLDQAINDSTADWQGSGGDAVRQHLTQVSAWLGETAKGAMLTGRQQEIHSQTLNETQKQMAANPPLQFDVGAANARLAQITDPVQFAVQAEQDTQAYQAQQSAREQAARIMTQFDETVGSAVTTPKFPAAPTLPQGVVSAGGGTTLPSATTPGAAVTASVPSLGSVPGNPAGAVPSGGGTPSGAGVPSGGGIPSDAVTPSGAGMPSGVGIPSGADPSTGGFSPGSVRGTGGGTPSSGVPLSASPSGAAPKMPDVNYPHTGSPVHVPGSGSGEEFSKRPLFDETSPSSMPSGRTGASGSGSLPTIGWSGGVNGDSIASRLNGGPAPGAFPTGDPGSFGAAPGLGGDTTGLKGGSTTGGAVKGGLPGGAGFKGGPAGLGGTGGSAAGRLTAGGASGAQAEEGVAGRAGGVTAGVAGAAGRPGALGGSMVPGAGAHKGEGDEDKEHRVADYIEGDDDLFEGEQVVAPPVIGDWKNNKDFKKGK